MTKRRPKQRRIIRTVQAHISSVAQLAPSIEIVPATGTHTAGMIGVTEAKKPKAAWLSVAAAKQAIPPQKRKQASLFEQLEQNQTLRQQLQEQGITQIGAILSAPEWRALIAIARLLQNVDAYAEAKTREAKNNGKVTPREITVSQKEYLDAYGVTKIVNKRKENDYAASEVQTALEALQGLGKSIPQVYSEKIPASKGKFNAIKVIAPLATTYFEYPNISGELEQEVRAGDTSGRGLRRIRIKPSELFFILDFFYLPEAIYHALEQKYDKNKLTGSLYNLTTILALELHKGGTNFSRSLEALGYNVGKGYLLETRQKKRLRDTLESDVAKLESVGAVEGGVRFRNDFSGEKVDITIKPEAYGTKPLLEAGGESSDD